MVEVRSLDRFSHLHQLFVLRYQLHLLCIVDGLAGTKTRVVDLIQALFNYTRKLSLQCPLLQIQLRPCYEGVRLAPEPGLLSFQRSLFSEEEPTSCSFVWGCTLVVTWQQHLQAVVVLVVHREVESVADVAGVHARLLHLFLFDFMYHGFEVIDDLLVFLSERNEGVSHGCCSCHVGGALVSSSLSSHFVRWSSWVELRLHLCFVLQVNESLALWLSLVSTSHLLHRLWTLTAL